MNPWCDYRKVATSLFETSRECGVTFACARGTRWNTTLFAYYSHHRVDGFPHAYLESFTATYRIIKMLRSGGLVVTPRMNELIAKAGSGLLKNADGAQELRDLYRNRQHTGRTDASTRLPLTL